MNPDSAPRDAARGFRSRLPSNDLDYVVDSVADWRDLRGQSVFVTGGSGFVGSWLLESLLRAIDRLDLRVSVFVLTRRPDSLSEKSPSLARHVAVRLLKGDLAGFEFPEGQFAYVIHSATNAA